MGVLDFARSPDEDHRDEELLSRVNVARALLQARLDRGWTQAEVGRAAGSKQSRVSEIESLGGNVRFETLDRIARVLDLAITLVPRVPAQELTPHEFSGYNVVVVNDGTVPVGGSERRLWALPHFHRGESVTHG